MSFNRPWIYLTYMYALNGIVLDRITFDTFRLNYQEVIIMLSV